MDLLLPASVFLPMLAAPVSYIIGRKSKNARNIFAMAVQALILFPTLWLLVRALSGKDAAAFSLEGFAATPENVAAGDYPLGTQGYVVIRSDEPEGSPARRLFDWFGSPLSDIILTHNSVTPLHDD